MFGWRQAELRFGGRCAYVVRHGGEALGALDLERLGPRAELRLAALGSLELGTSLGPECHQPNQSQHHNIRLAWRYATELADLLSLLCLESASLGDGRTTTGLVRRGKVGLICMTCHCE